MLTKKISKFIKILQTSYYLKALVRFGVAAGVEHAQLLDHLKSIDFLTLVDVGAIRDQFELVAIEQFPQARIISFEPLSESVVIFMRLFNSDTLTSLHQIAIGSIDKKMPMHVTCADDFSYLLPISVLQSSMFPGTKEEQVVRSIAVTPLNAILNEQDILPPALLKIDVQGFELEVLKGCQPLLHAFKDIYVECSFMELYTGQALPHEIIILLCKSGFNLCGVYHLDNNQQGAAVQGNFLFENQCCNA